MSDEAGVTLGLQQDNLKQDNSDQTIGLLDLPPELWSKIGHYAIDLRRDVELWPYDNMALVKQPPITCVSAALRSELLSYFYKTRVELRLWEKVIDIHLGNHPTESRPSPKCTWLSTIGAANRRNLRNVWIMAYEDKIARVLSKVKFMYGEVELGEGTETMERGRGAEYKDPGELFYRVTFK